MNSEKSSGSRATSRINLGHCLVSAGGTMNREAAVLGVPAYTVFMGKIGAIDKHLIDMGRIVPLHTIDDLKKIRVMKNPRKTALNNDDLVRKLVNILIYHEKTTFFASYFCKPSA